MFRISHWRPSQWPRGLRLGSATARLLGFRVRIPLVTWLSLSVVSVISCQVEVSASGLSRGVLPNVVCLSVIVNRRQWGSLFATILAPE
jgi:hypothetical protein